MKTKLSHIIVAVILACSLFVAGTAHAGYSEPDGYSTLVGGAK